jgi:crotonobetainyl-CoA:carnitine CoA-transferase CaiB-like acyl-CoA transferase
MTGALQGLRVLDLATSRAELCGRTLAELGADVVKVEPPSGVESRHLPPIAPDGRSLYWDSVGVGKSSVAADLTTEAGRAAVRELAGHADVLIESFDPGVMADHGLSYDDLAAVNPELVYVSVTPYGQDGPKARWAASDLTLEAAGGRLALQRDDGRPPVPIGYPQASFHAGVQAAADALVALHARRRTGRGQHLDVSMQAVMVHTLFSQASGARLNDAVESVGTMDDPDADRAAKLKLLPGIWACADGYVAAPLTAGALPLVAHIMREEPVDDDLAAYDWNRLVADVLRGRVEDEFVLRALRVVERFFLARTKAELFALAFSGDFRLGPLQTTRDLLDDPHLRARGYWPTVAGITRPGPAVRFGATPMEVDLAVTAAPGSERPEDVAARWPARAAAPSPPPSGGSSASAFAGLKVADFSWVAVGPTIGRAFADHGATVVRVESAKRLDVARTLAPWKGDAKGVNDSNWYAHYNAGKLGLALDLSSEEGRAVARRLIDWADVVIESFSAGTMAKLGLDYETVSATNPGLVMLSTSLLGQTGPLATFAGFGQQAVGLCGISTITGWPDRPPLPPMGAYTDVVAPKYGIAAIAAALHARARDGRGQYLDLSQVEASIRFIEPLVLDESVNGRTAGRPGLRSDRACPHGVYPLAGENRYAAIAVETDEQWRALRRLLGDALSPFDEDLDLAGRRAVEDRIDAAIAEWTSSPSRTGEEVERTLAADGVPAARVAKPAQVAHDPQLEHRGFFVPLDHTAMGRCDYEAPATRFSADPHLLRKAAPCLGEHTDVVLTELLGYGTDEVERLAAAGVLT